MGDAQDDGPGIGRVVYRVEPEPTPSPDDADRKEADRPITDDEVVIEASEESFPASDPPGYTRGPTI